MMLWQTLLEEIFQRYKKTQVIYQQLKWRQMCKRPSNPVLPAPVASATFVEKGKR
jgi:hypothetical protein